MRGVHPTVCGIAFLRVCGLLLRKEDNERRGMRRASRMLLLAGVLAHVSWVVDPVDVERVVAGNESAVVMLLGVRESNGAEVQSSGCCVHPEGLILTTAHQIVGVKDLSAKTPDGKSCGVSVVELDKAREIALLKADRTFPKAVRIGDAGSLKSGSPLVSIATPVSLDFSVVSGMVSNSNRTYRGYPVIQADLRASPGSSGGPVFDRNGLLVGMIIGKLENEDWVTVINLVNNAYDMLKRHGVSVPRGTNESFEEEGVLTPKEGIGEKELRALEAYNRGVKSGDPEVKLEAYGAAVQLLPDFYEAWFNQGVVAGALGRADLVKSAYQRAGELRPEAVEVPRNLGRFYLHQQDFLQAQVCFEKARGLSPDSPQSYNDLGEVYRVQNRLEEAVTAYRKALDLKSDYAPAHYNLGLAYAGSNRAEEAVVEFEAYLTLSPQASDAEEVRAWIAKLKQQP